MKLLGVTGGMGMGKSTAAAFLRARGVSVVDTDEIARNLVAPGKPALAEIIARFGADLLDSSGALRRGALAVRVFGDPRMLRDLEAILHPRIRESWMSETRRWREAGVATGAVIIPLLYETGAETAFDRIICIGCSERTQSTRLRERGWDDQEIARRLAQQWPVAKKLQKADCVIWTDVPAEIHSQQLDLILAHVAN